MKNPQLNKKGGIQSILQREEGMTLVEIIASLFIIGLILTGFTAFFINASRASQRSERRSEANYYAQQIMEEIMYVAESSENRPEFISILESEYDWTFVSESGDEVRLNNSTGEFNTQLRFISLSNRQGEDNETGLNRVILYTFDGPVTNSDDSINRFESSVQFNSDMSGDNDD